jgi:hypothetical protein
MSWSKFTDLTGERIYEPDTPGLSTSSFLFEFSLSLGLQRLRKAAYQE